MTSPHPLLCHPSVSISNGASHREEDEDEQGEEFEFDDIGPPEMSSGSNLYAKTSTAQETASQARNGATSTNSSLHHQYCSDVEVRESPEGRSTSSDLGVTGESESLCKASSMYEEKPSVIAEGGQDEAGGAINGCSPQQDTAEAEVSSSVHPQTEHHTAEVGLSTSWTCSPDSVLRDPEVIYDDVPAENLQHLVRDVEDIYEDIQRPDHRGSNGWSSSEFESYDELSDSETVPPARSSSKLPADVLKLKERCAVTRRELAVRLSTPHVAHIRQSCDTKVQQLMKAARSGTKDGLEKTKLAMIRKVSFLQRKDPPGAEAGTGINKFT